MNWKNNFLTLTGLLLFCMACSEKEQQKIEQDSNFWLVFDAEEAMQNQQVLHWDYTLNRAGKYDVQILRQGDLGDILSEVTLESDGINITEIPKKVFVIDAQGSKQTVYQFSQNIVFKQAGLKSLKFSGIDSLEQVRIIPNYKNKLGFGSGKYEAEWQKMHNSPEKQAALEWLKTAKYGMFIHWGLYSQAGGIWKGKKMEESGYPGPGVSEWLMFKFQIPRKEYAELAKTFHPDKSFAQNIAKLAKDAGMKYVVITSKHHDGFALFDSKCSAYDMVDATPYKADAIKELYDACLAEGLDFGVYYSHGNDWYDGTDGNVANVKKRNDSLGILTHTQGKNLWDPSPNTHADYIQNKALPQIEELLHALPELRLVWFDGDGYVTEDQAFQFYKAIYDINPNVLVSRRVGYDFGDYLDAGDNVIPSADDEMNKQWETCGTTNNSWAYKSYDDDWKSTTEMLYYLVDIASKGGNYLLNIGPDGRGHVPEQSANGLREMGRWLETNGAAIYGTTRWIVPHEVKTETLLEGTAHRAKKGFSRTFTENDFWFTLRQSAGQGDVLYAISFFNPESKVDIKSLNKSNVTIENVSLLGSAATIPWEQTERALTVDLTGVSVGTHGYVLEVKVKN